MSKHTQGSVIDGTSRTKYSTVQNDSHVLHESVIEYSTIDNSLVDASIIRYATVPIKDSRILNHSSVAYSAVEHSRLEDVKAEYTKVIRSKVTRAQLNYGSVEDSDIRGGKHSYSNIRGSMVEDCVTAYATIINSTVCDGGKVGDHTKLSGVIVCGTGEHNLTNTIPGSHPFWKERIREVRGTTREGGLGDAASERAANIEENEKAKRDGMGSSSTLGPGDVPSAANHHVLDPPPPYSHSGTEETRIDLGDPVDQMAER